MGGSDSMAAPPRGESETAAPRFMTNGLKLILVATFFVGQGLLYADIFFNNSSASLPTSVTMRRGATATHETERTAGSEDDADAELRYRRLRLNWTQLSVTSPLATLFRDNQNNCALPAGSFKFRNKYGMGSDMHLWTLSLCIAFQNKVRIHTELPWIFRDDDACSTTTTPKRTGSGNGTLHPPLPRSPMDCYFPHAEPRCPNDDDETGSSNNSGAMKLYDPETGYPNRFECAAVRRNHSASISDLRAAGVEFLFSSVSSLVVDEAHRQLNALFSNTGGSGPSLPGGDTAHSDIRGSNNNNNSSRFPAVLLTVYVRWGDKKIEVAPRPMSEYVDAVHALLKQRNVSDPTTVGIFLASEDPRAVHQFQIEADKNRWRVFVDMYYQEFSAVRNSRNNGNPKMAKTMRGRPGLVALASLLVALQADDYVLTTTSNWGRLMNELRKNVLDPRCNNCTRMVDLDPGEW